MYAFTKKNIPNAHVSLYRMIVMSFWTWAKVEHMMKIQHPRTDSVYRNLKTTMMAQIGAT
jgi:hypothetical protein